MSIAEEIEKAQDQFLASKIHRSRAKSIYPSRIEDVCDRRQFLYLTCGELAQEVTIDLQAIFEEGNDQEPGVRRYMSTLGFEVVQAQAAEFDPKYNLSGKIDGMLEKDGKRYLCEIKTVSDYAWDKLKTAEDFDEGYYKKWLGQMMIYLFLWSMEKGIFILKKKSAKRIRVIEVSLDYEYAESLLKKAERINAAFKANTPPDFLKNNPVECRRCAFFGTSCNPPLDFGKGIVNIEDEELAKKLSRREELIPTRSEYDALDKEVKERLKEIPDGICGAFHIIGKEGQRAYKATEAKIVKTWSTKIERIEQKTEV